ncbi:MAG TPA: DpnII family type II restriction endonuclease [Cellvibrio sp.]|nr:DpnII family type II restriction endonuclease [Cellvibrio sp.]
MKLVQQNIEDITSSLSPLDTSWRDATAEAAIERICRIPQKLEYTRSDILELLTENFEIGLLVSRLFLKLSKDELETELTDALGAGGIGVKRFSREPELFADALDALQLREAMAETVNFPAEWSDILVERLRSTRGKAIRGQQRGRNLEDFVEQIVRDIFGVGGYETRCQFTGANGETAKCDFAIPARGQPRILIEVKGYGATGSKMTDVIGDLNTIIREKRHDTPLFFFTDGVTWKRRLSDLDKIVKMQNTGQIMRIYTTKMAADFREDLQTLKSELGLDL